jgi:hypothetical protein
LVELFSDTTQTTAANAVTSTASRTYGLQLNASNQGVINVPWTDTTYSAGTALDLSGSTFNLDLSELSTSTSNADGDYFVVIDSANAQYKLTKANVNISGFNGDSLTISAGTATVAPITLTSGTNLTAATSGALEYDGNSLYFTTNNSTGRGQVRSVHTRRRDTNSSTTTSSTLQSIYGASLTLEADTVYHFKQVLFPTLSFSSATVALRLGFTFSQTQQAFGVIYTGTSGSVQYTSYQSSPAAYTIATVTGTTSFGFVCEGFFKTHATLSSTITPGFAMAATAGSARIDAGSYIEIQKVSPDLATTVAGGWA